jgi:hypothetical protein
MRVMHHRLPSRAVDAMVSPSSRRGRFAADIRRATRSATRTTVIWPSWKNPRLPAEGVQGNDRRRRHTGGGTHGRVGIVAGCRRVHDTMRDRKLAMKRAG